MKVFKVDGVPVTMDQIIVYACVILIVVAGALILRYTDVGLRVRAMVDSPAMTSLSGTNPGAVSVGVWAVSVTLAGLTGVLAAPIIGLDPGNVHPAHGRRLRRRDRRPAAQPAHRRARRAAAWASPARLVIKYLPPASSLTTAVIPSIPFVVTAVFLVYYS